MNNKTAWIFAYGSLIFKTDFPFLKRQPAYINGWSRRFWQGSHDHRGLPGAPGRVVTLVPETKEVCQGVAYLINCSVLEQLDYREKNGYVRVVTSLYFDEGADAECVVYIARENNEAYLGEAPLHEIAAHIHKSHGPSGSNSEYLLLLAQSLRQLAVDDPHVFALEKLVREKS